MTRRRVLVSLVLGLGLLATVAGLSFSVLASRNGPASLDERARAVAATLRCPVCLNLSVADSPSPVAQQMRSKIRQELQAGKSTDAIQQEFVAAYGEWILLSPKRAGLNLLAWGLPPILLVLGLVGLILLIRRWTKPVRPPAQLLRALSDEDRRLLDHELARVGDLE